MKQWTVMLIPHERGSTRALHLSVYQIWLVVLLLAGVTFTMTFLYGRNYAMNRQIDRRLQQVRQELERQRAEQAAKPARSESLTPQERIELENRLRAEYNASIAAVTAKLDELRDVEEAARKLTGRTAGKTASEIPNARNKGGKGGVRSRFDEVAYEPDTRTAGSPSFIEGLSHPSADLIIQEIDLRKSSLRGLVEGLKAEQEQVSHYPSTSPALFFRHGISSPFGWRKDPMDLRLSHHDGVDIMGAPGSPVAATGKGVVIYAGYDGEWGNVVRIEHGNGLLTIYAHLQKVLVKVGQKIERKEVVGKLGCTGRSTGPHLHYEVHRDGRPVNPMQYMRD